MDAAEGGCATDSQSGAFACGRLRMTLKRAVDCRRAGDTILPMETAHPTSMKNIDDRELRVTWDDGNMTRYIYRTLRSQCPCAACVNEWTGERVLDPASIPESIKPDSVTMVGNYAIQFHWSDGHDTGIYTFETLKRIAEPPTVHDDGGSHGA